MFKFVVICALVAAVSAANNYGHKNFGGRQQAGHQQAFHHQASHQQAYQQQASHHQASHAATSDDVHAEVKSFANDVRADGFQYAYDTTNGIAAAESGDAYGNAHGDFGWISPEGVHVAVQYVADENGYQPSGDLLPTPPPIPAAILKALEYIRTHPPKEEHVKTFGNKRF